MHEILHAVGLCGEPHPSLLMSIPFFVTLKLYYYDIKVFISNGYTGYGKRTKPNNATKSNNGDRNGTRVLGRRNQR